MNADQITNLQKLLSEYDYSLTRMDAEKDLQTAIAARAVVECGLDKKNFAVVAKAMHKGDLHRSRQAAIDQADLFEVVLGDEASESAEFQRRDWVVETKSMDAMQ